MGVDRLGHTATRLPDGRVLVAGGLTCCKITPDSVSLVATDIAEVYDAETDQFEVTGSLAAAWLDSRVAGTIFAARGAGRPLWIGAGKHELLFASTRRALEVVEQYARVKLRKLPSSPASSGETMNRK